MERGEFLLMENNIKIGVILCFWNRTVYCLLLFIMTEELELGLVLGFKYKCNCRSQWRIRTFTYLLRCKERTIVFSSSTDIFKLYYWHNIFIHHLKPSFYTNSYLYLFTLSYNVIIFIRMKLHYNKFCIIA